MSSRYPDNVYAKVKEIVDKYDSLPSQIEQAKKQVRKLKGFQEIVENLIDSEITDLIYEERHSRNISQKKNAGMYGNQAKVVPSRSASVRGVYVSEWYSFTIGPHGTMLGDMTRPGLIEARDAEEGIVQGHVFNRDFCEVLISKLKDDKSTVREKVKSHELDNIAKRLAGRRDLGESAA